MDKKNPKNAKNILKRENMRGNCLTNYKNKYFKAIKSKEYTGTGTPTDQFKKTGSRNRAMFVILLQHFILIQ